MDPIAVLQSRIEQLEAKLGMSTIDGQQVDGTVVENLANAVTAIQNSITEHEKLNEAKQRATEINKYTDSNFIEKLQENDMKVGEVVAAESMIGHHCHCMQRCKQATPVLESEPLAQVPKMIDTVDQMHTTAAAMKQRADEVSQGVQELAQTCGAAAADASEQLAGAAHNLEQIEIRKFPQRRNGLDF